MTPAIARRGDPIVSSAPTVSAGFRGHVVPEAFLGEVRLDPNFTGSASRGPSSPYFSQMDNLDAMVLIYTPYAPDPVRERTLFVATSALAPVLEVHVPASGQTSVRPVIGGLTADLRQASESTLALADICEQMRDLVDLPVQDLARMAGIGRRQFYNLLGGRVPAMRSSDDERRLRAVHQHLVRLGALAGDKAVRSAVLTPLVSHQGRSYFDLAEAGDLDELKVAIEDVEALVASTHVDERLPPSGTFAADDPRWAKANDFLEDDGAPGE